MKSKILSLILSFTIALSYFASVTNFVCASADSLNVKSSVYTVTYSESGNTIGNIPAGTKINTFLYNMRQDNPDYNISIFAKDGTTPDLWNEISEYSTKRMYIIVKKNNSDIGEHFVLVPRTLTSLTGDFENYAEGIFVSDSFWKYIKTSQNTGIGYIRVLSDGNRVFTSAHPAAGDNDYKATDSTSYSNLVSPHFSVPDGKVAQIKFRLRNNNSKVAVSMRDSNQSADGHYIHPVNTFGKIIKCFYSTGTIEDITQNAVTFEYGTWVDFKITIDRSAGNEISVCVNGTYTKSYAVSAFPDFDWNDFKIQFGASPVKNGELRGETDVDGFSFTLSGESYSSSFVKDVNIYSKTNSYGIEYSGMTFTGDNRIKITLKNTNNISSPLTFYAAEKSHGELIKLTSLSIPYENLNDTYYALDLNITDAAKNTIELYIWDSVSLTPLNVTIKPPASQISRAVSNGHPRVLADKNTFNAISSYTHPMQTKWKETVLTYADLICTNYTTTDKSSDFYIGDLDGFSDVANRVKKFAPCLGMAYRLTGDKTYSEKLYDILIAASTLDGWNDGTVSNLTVAYMTEGFSFGFDWCYDAFSAEQKQEIADFAIDYCLGFAIKEYQNISRGSHTWSITYTNHNCIPNSSFITGAIAFADYAPQTCQTVLDYASQRLQIFMAGLFPDGGWWEGPMYTNLFYSHMARASETMRLNFGTDDVIASGGFINNAADFFISVSGPLGSYNFAEQETPTQYAIPELLWLANITNRDDVRSYALKCINFNNVSNCILALIWADNPEKITEHNFENKYIRGIEHITLGNGYNENSSWLSVLGGVNQGSHKHLDLGSFIYDYNGVRWASELGLDEYYKGYHANTSAEKIFYRSRSEGHNTLVINPSSADGGQRMNDSEGISKGEVIKYNLRQNNPFAIYDLTTAYQDKATSVKRGFRLLDNNVGFVVRDEFITSDASDTVYWFMHTEAQITVSDDRKTAILEKDGKTMKLTVLEDNLSFEIVDAITPEPIRSELLAISSAKGLELHKQNWNGYKEGDTNTDNDLKKLQIKHTGSASGSITVMLSTENTDIPYDFGNTLENWN